MKIKKKLTEKINNNYKLCSVYIKIIHDVCMIETIISSIHYFNLYLEVYKYEISKYKIYYIF